MTTADQEGAQFMANEQHIFQPDYSLSPGSFLEESLESMGISARELARRCGRSAKLISEILAGKAPIEPETALQFEKVTTVNATVWLNLEAEYRLHLARAQEESQFANAFAWAREFPLKELEDRGVLGPAKDKADSVRKLLQFFGVAGVDACEAAFSSLSVSYRHSPSFQSDRKALFAWLRLGELEAESMVCKDYDRATFLQSLAKIRALSLKNIETFLPEIAQICAQAGVAFVISRPLGKVALSGVSRWLSPRKAMIQQTMRHMSNDHFWFTFFHEAAHVLLHSRKTVFIDGKNLDGATPELEEEANRWATEFLIPPEELSNFIQAGDFSQQAVREFAREQEIAPGIVVGQLQNKRHLNYGQLNQLKDRYEWYSGATG
jgi:HTH-type transcriptional regulator / antitoxin HigA